MYCKNEMWEIVSTKENYIYEKLPNNKSTITHTHCNNSGNTHSPTKDLNQRSQESMHTHK
jgi:hypothetical protein